MDFLDKDISLQPELLIRQPGKVQEWLIWLAWKAGIPQGIKGSNPFLSAEKTKSVIGNNGAFLHYTTLKTPLSARRLDPLVATESGLER